MAVLTGVPALRMGRESWPAADTAVTILAGTALVGAGCGALNAWYERDRDARMSRTVSRPLPAGRLTPREALLFGLGTSALGLALLHAVGGWLPVLVGIATLVHYVGIYTAWLKPRSPQSIVVGGAAGAIAPVLAASALDGRIGLWSVVLFAIVFLWQPPHVWAITLYRKGEYAEAGFPMLPAVVGEAATRRRMLAYTLFLIPVTLLPWVGGVLGVGYGAVALGAGAFFVARVLRSIHEQTPKADRRVFTGSLVYLSLLLAAMLVELLA
jgi:protoheme IX farnesyltransferase